MDIDSAGIEHGECRYESESDKRDSRSAPTLQEVCSAYVRGRRVNAKPRMVAKMMQKGVRFNWLALLLGPFYYLYRKQWVAGWIFFAVDTVIGFAGTIAESLPYTAASLPAPAVIAILILGLLDQAIPLVGTIVMAFAFYPLYFRSAVLAYGKWKDIGNEAWEVSRLIEDEGGTSWIAVVAAIAIDVAFALILTLAIPAPTINDLARL